MAEHRNSLPATATALVLFAGAIVLVNVSLQSGSYDDRLCDSLLESRNQVWELQNSCGVGWFGTFALTIAVVTIAAVMAAVSLLVQRSHLPARTAYWLMSVAAIGSISVAVALGISIVSLVLWKITPLTTRGPDPDQMADA